MVWNVKGSDFMQPVKVIEWVDIQAPRQAVFDLVLDLERRLQLSPLWGTTTLEEKTPDYPAEGSLYRLRLNEPPENIHPTYETTVTALEPLRKFAYRLCIDRETRVSWTTQDVQQGTRLVYTEEFLLNEGEDEEFTQAVRKVVHEWLEHIRRYAELRQTPMKRLAKWLVDHFYLRLRPDQRRLVLTILFMHAVGSIGFILSALAWGIGSLLF